jgi:hypothetical protein
MIMGYAYALDDYRAYLNGVAGTPDTSGDLPISLTTIRIGERNGGIQQANGTIEYIRYYNTSLTNAQLQVLTT